MTGQDQPATEQEQASRRTGEELQATSDLLTHARSLAYSTLLSEDDRAAAAAIQIQLATRVRRLQLRWTAPGEGDGPGEAGQP